MVLVFAMLFLIVAFSLILGYAMHYSKKAVLTLGTEQDKYMVQVKEAVTRAYEANAWDVDSFLTHDQYLDIGKWLSLAGVTPKWTLTGAVSDRIQKNGLTYTVIAFWMQTDDGGTNDPIFDAATGVLTLCPNVTAECPDRKWVLIDGQAIQQANLDTTTEVMNEVALKMETYFKARYVFDPNHDTDVNYFRTTNGSCTTPNTEDLPCVDVYTPIAEAQIQHKLGIDTQQTRNGWGRPIFISNKEDSSLTFPYTMALKSELPWGGSYVMKATQPL